jgi:hypothetical protein
MSAKMDGKLNLDLNTLTGGGKFVSSSVVINGSKTLEKVGDVLKIKELKNLTVPNVNISFTFTNGRLYTQPFDMKVKKIDMTVSGSNGFDKTLDYTLNMKIPREVFGSEANSVLNNFMSEANKKGVNLSAAEYIPVAIKIGGTYDEPKISTDLANTGAKVVDDLKAAAKAEFEKQKAEAEAKARAEGEKLKTEAEKRLNEQKAKAQAEGDKLKKEAEAKAKAAQDSAKKAAEKKAKDELKKWDPFKKK